MHAAEQGYSHRSSDVIAQLLQHVKLPLFPERLWQPDVADRIARDLLVC